MLQEAHTLLRNGIDVKAGFIETHGREETDALAIGIPTIERRSIFYKGKYLEEMDLQAIINDHPEVVLVDELAHTNVEGSKTKTLAGCTGNSGKRNQRNQCDEYSAHRKPE